MLGIIFLLCLKFYISAAVYGAYGLTASFTCEHTVNQGYAYFWQKKGTSDGYYQYLANNQNKYANAYAKTLVILNLNFADSGSYRCYLQSPRALGQDQELIVTNITQTTILEDLYGAIYEQDITLECLIKTDPSNKKLYWLKNGKDLRPYLSSKYSGGTLSEQSLTIKNVDNNDAGNYTCKLENQFWTSKDVVELKVLYVPLVYQSSDTIKAFTGDTITLKCVYESNPEPSVVFWKRDGEILNVSDSKYNGSTINEPSLTIVNIDQFDSGAYVCAVVNNIGTGYSSNFTFALDARFVYKRCSSDA